jgi:hypothetical protein
MNAARMRQAAIWMLFAAALVLATAPAWRVIAYGVSPTLDQGLAFICRGVTASR